MKGTAQCVAATPEQGRKMILTFFAIDVIQEVNGIFHHAVTYITVIPGSRKREN